MIDDVADLIRTIGTSEVLDRFRQLAEADVREKAPGDLVTTADLECERALTSALRGIRNVPVVGEEAVAQDPAVLGALQGDAAWLVDDLRVGGLDKLFYWRTQPWDHAPGSLIVDEAGLRSGRPDGSIYLPGDGRRGLPSADPAVWSDLGPRIAAATAPDSSR